MCSTTGTGAANTVQSGELRFHVRGWCGERYRHWRGVACDWRCCDVLWKTGAICTVTGEDATNASRAIGTLERPFSKFSIFFKSTRT